MEYTVMTTSLDAAETTTVGAEVRNDTCSDEWSHFQKNIPVVIVFSIFVVTGVVGNSLILYIYGLRFKKTTTRVFILSLAFFDLITCVTLPYKIALLRNPQLFLNGHLARLEIVRLYFLQVSAMILPLVSIDRYRRICTPYKKQISPTLAKLLVLGVSIVNGAINIFRMAVSRGNCYRAEALISPDYVRTDVDNSWVNEFYFMYVILPFIIPLPILIVMYLLVGIKVRRMSSTSKPNTARVSDHPRETPPGSLRMTRQRTEGRISIANLDIFSAGEEPQGHNPEISKENITNGSKPSYPTGRSNSSQTSSRTVFLGRLESGPTDEHCHGTWRRYSYGQATRDRESLRSSTYPHAVNHNSVCPQETRFERNTPTPDDCIFGGADFRPSYVASSTTTASPATQMPDAHAGITTHVHSVSDSRLPWKRMTVIFFLITLIYVISCIPFFVIYMIFRVDHVYGHNLLSSGGYIVLYDLVYITVVSNCFLYGFFDPRFQRELKSLKAKIGERVFTNYRLCDGDA